MVQYRLALVVLASVSFILIFVILPVKLFSVGPNILEQQKQVGQISDGAALANGHVEMIESILGRLAALDQALVTRPRSDWESAVRHGSGLAGI